MAKELQHNFFYGREYTTLREHGKCFCLFVVILADRWANKDDDDLTSYFTHLGVLLRLVTRLEKNERKHKK